MIACVDIICGILLAFVRTRDVGVSSRNVVSRTFPHFSQSMLKPMIFIYASLMYFHASNYFKHVYVFPDLNVLLYIGVIYLCIIIIVMYVTC